MDSLFKAIKAQLMQLDAAFQNLTADQIRSRPDKVYGVHLNKLNRLAAVPVAEEVVRKLLADPELEQAVLRISRLKRQIGLSLERRFVESLTCAADPWADLEQFVYYPNYLALARMEFAGAGLQEGDRVVFLESGPLPLSLICLSRQHGVQGVGIEQDQRYAALSERAIHTLGLSREIRIICGDHFVLPLRGPRRLIMVGADAVPKAEIFAHLVRALKPGEMISYRIYEKGLRQLFDAGSFFNLPPQFRECARIRPEPPVNNTVVFALRTGAYLSKTAADSIP